MSDVLLVKSDAPHDERLAQLLAQLVEQQHQGERLDLEAVARAHPDLAAELRELWPAMQLAEALAKPLGDPQRTVQQPRPTPAASEPTVLPRSFGDYLLTAELGRGGMGVVFKARQLSLERDVAVKMILGGTLASGADLARFRAEAEAAARLDHPNIVSVYEVGDYDGQAYFSMQYVEGTTLAARVADGPLAPRLAARYLARIAHAVHRAHQNGILHRDLKPSNVLIDKDDQPHVTDFGLAKRVEGSYRLTQTGAIVGTPSYMSPEQAAGSRGVLGPASDVYSLGAVLYELLTGKPPFQAASAVDTIMLVLEQEPLPPRLLNSQVDRDLEMICLKCLQKPADLRYASAADLAADLEAFLQGEPIAARSGSLRDVVGSWFRDTHHAAVLENWGVLWMWHSLKIFLLCAVTNWMFWMGVADHRAYLALWGVGLVAWGAIFWTLRRRSGPVLFIERQIAHAWGAGIIASIGLFVVEVLLKLPALTLSPILAVFAGMVFVMKAGMLSGIFYFAAVAFFLTAVLMAWFPSVGLLLFGTVSAASFFFPGLKYYRQRMEARRVESLPEE